ncbi:hypothetical protein QJS83_14160 [Bdellovibrio sp. 22V]|uniref:hypothetical protein n=1 Tax=Bdellovibrio TaxID=958 RepID=UPI002543C669|nr:hypothetical protein [Bdellovibrio sp. 22V]WII71610.1 hypothetical protein QJS83_14160 [Bdellovibrio sp. 22V]
MKNLFLVLVTFILGHMQTAHASGCGGPEYSIEETRVLQTFSFAEAVKNFSMSLSADAQAKITDTSISFYSEKMNVPEYLFFYWHEARSSKKTPENMTFNELAAHLKSSQVELVEDRFFVNCGYAETNTKNNFRIRFNYNGQEVELRTGYVPEARSW